MSITHGTYQTLENIKNKIHTQGDLPYALVEEQLKLLEELSSFPLGKFLIENGGLNGYYTHYILNYDGSDTSTDLERFLLKQSPIVLAMRERYQCFKRLLSQLTRPGMRLLNVPCGLMGEFLTLDIPKEVTFVGFDIDQESLDLAEKLAREKGWASFCEFIKGDVWELNETAEYDVISSNGLNFYEPDDEKTTHLYRRLYEALKPGGTLLTSFLTPPPFWDMSEINQEHLLKQKLLLSDILEGKWQCFRSVELTKSQLVAAGFLDVALYWDKAQIFPSVTAKKG